MGRVAKAADVYCECSHGVCVEVENVLPLLRMSGRKVVKVVAGSTVLYVLRGSGF